MKHFSVLIGIFLLMFAVTCPTIADQAGDAQNLVEQAISMMNGQGRVAALKAINDKNGPFVKGDLYVFALTMDNVMVGHPHEHSLLGINLTHIKDAANIPLFQRFKEVAETKGSGWVEYMWAKPGEKEPSPKKSFVKKVPGENLYVGAGFYVNKISRAE